MSRRKRRDPITWGPIVLTFLTIALSLAVIVRAAYQGKEAQEPAQTTASVALTPLIVNAASWDAPEPTRAPEAPRGVQEAPEPTPDPGPEPEWIEFTATAYCPCEKCCGIWAKNRPNGIVYTASGAVAQESVTIAADWDVLPPGTVVFIDGLGERIVQDRGGGVTGNAVDIYFADHQAALRFGRQTVRLYIVKGE